MSSIIEKISPELDYVHKVGNHSSPLYVKLQPINNIQTFNASLTSVYGPIEILIPAKCLSLKKSRVSFDLTIPAQAANTFSWMQGNALCMFDRVTITSQNTNQVLMDIPNFNRYASMLSPILTSNVELNNKSSPLYGLAVTPAMFTTQALAQQQPLEDVSRSNASVNVDGLSTDIGTPYMGIRKLFVSSAVATANALAFEFELGSIQASICDLEQLLYFAGEQLLISFYFAPVSRFAWGGTSASVPSTNVIPATGNWSVNNLALYLYTEQNIGVSTALVEKVMRSGLSIPFPYAFISRNSVSSGSWAVTQQLTRGFGSKLLFVATSIFNPTESGNTAQDHSVSGLLGATNGQYTSLNYNSYIDNVAILTNNNIQFINTNAGTQSGEHWLYNKEHLKGSSINSLINYNVDFCHIDSFINDSLCSADWTAIDGLSLDAMHQFSFVSYGSSSNSVTNNVYIIFVCQKTLTLSPSGVQIV